MAVQNQQRMQQEQQQEQQQQIQQQQPQPPQKPHRIPKTADNIRIEVAAPTPPIPTTGTDSTANNSTTSTSLAPITMPQHHHQQQQQQQSTQANNIEGAAGGGVATAATAATAAGGPRVSFNRDVHVKRIGKRPNEISNYETTNLLPPQNVSTSYHQLPADLSTESIRKEAALVLAQAERHKSKAENADNIPTFKVKTKRSGGETSAKKFHSLPARKKKLASKPVARSVSDAAAKKPAKRPSIFSIFSRKSDSNINQAERDPRFEDSGGRRLVRSKSDVSSTPKEERKLKKTLKESKQPQSSSAKQLPTQLTPIIENAQKEEYFAQQFNRERRKSDAITDREKHESDVSELIERSRAKAEVDGSLIGPNPVSDSIKDKIIILHTNSAENMHSSQLPAQKLPLTKGITVNGMVKRLSMERFSPPPSGPAFSYIRPNDGITYAQLDLNDDLYERRSPSREIRTPIRDYRSPVRDVRSIDRELRPSATLNHRHSVDRTDFHASHHHNSNNHINNIRTTTTAYSPMQSSQHQNPNHSSRIIIEAPGRRPQDSFSPVPGPTTIRISSSHSPSPWQQLSPRNLSDEDEGLGIETRKYYHDDELSKPQTKIPAEPPIIPVIRSITPTRENGFDKRAYLSPARDDPAAAVVDDLGYRRARLESRILTRRFGDSATLDRGLYNHPNHNHSRNYHHSSNSPERNREMREVSTTHHHYLNTERDPYEHRFHKPESNEILHKYSPERSHLDIIAPKVAPTVEKTSRYKHTKYYDDGHGGVKEVYERETHEDGQGKPQVRESRHRERLDSYTSKRDHSSAERQYIDYEPKSLESQFTSTDHYRSSPENMKRYDLGVERGVPLHPHELQQQQQTHLNGEEHWQSTLKRDKLQQRSFDKGDSGIENDFRKESFNGDITTRWRKRTIVDDMKACETFLKKERRHTEQQHVMQPNTSHYIYRERSIDDGSHFDPHLDKYTSTTTNTLRRKDQQSQTTLGQQDTLKRTKKKGGFEKVKQLFTGGGGGGGGSSSSGGGGGDGGSTSKKESGRHKRANSTTSSSTQTPPKDKDKDGKYLVKEEEMRSRYNEHRTSIQEETLREPKATDISTRRRLSTPKASPLLLKRTSSDKTKNQSPLAKPEKTSWFKSLDRRSKSKSKEKLSTPANIPSDTSSMKRSKTSRITTTTTTTITPPTPPPPQVTTTTITTTTTPQGKNLRFFGDTDLDSNPPTISRANTTLKARAPLASTLNRSQKYSQSAFHLDRIQPNPLSNNDYRRNLSSSTQNVNTTSRHKSSSMHNLENGGGANSDEVDFRKRRHYSRSRDLDDISESGSETEDQQKRPNGISANTRTLSRERLDRSHRYDDHSYRRSNDRQLPMMSSTPNGGGGIGVGGGGSGGETTNSTQFRRTTHHLAGPPKPARSAERRILSSYSRERDRFPAESSGTEGESSLHSQRSIVYLHATTVGAIPQPYHLRRRSMSRDDLRSNKSKNSSSQLTQPQPLQPMTRTVSRSVSMLAPWKPKLISEGYEINYSQEQNKRMSTLPRKPHTNGNGNSTSTLIRTHKKTELPPSRIRRHENHIKDDQSSLRNSSTTSASKSHLSSNLRTNADTRRKLK